MAYADHLRKLLAPLGVYDLNAGTVSGAMIEALGESLDDVWQVMQDGLREAFPQTAEDLTQWERVLPVHGAAPSPAVRRAGISHLLGQEEVSCSAAQIEAALAACGVQTTLELDGDTVQVCSSLPETADRAALARALIPAHLDLEWVQE